MENVIVLVVVATFVILIVGVLKPKWVLPPALKPSLFRVLGIYGGLIVLLLIAVIVGERRIEAEKMRDPAYVKAKVDREQRVRELAAKAKFASEHDSRSAYAMAQVFIKKQLKTPASADFPPVSDEGVKILKVGAAKYRVSGYVDAQNSFGAKLRKTWMCELEYVGDDKWRATSTLCGLVR
jgi:hypothetical protein